MSPEYLICQKVKKYSENNEDISKNNGAGLYSLRLALAKTKDNLSIKMTNGLYNEL